ncbi:MAG: glycerol-3-phosphate 1-O-acyltransferase PlsY [Finegoldia magna]|uniref:glycerol-3-phosphate 1-O-acyltransferase PlsY n=1 Tax=Finegoldia magna TaxID=1260 RepID=UPI00290A1280|nr:glycerol-3-phosphate 1-O-acyltransferase PlsY [Finegoldia magna]MDU7033045.1 glycerol-3-phosphate 1-O-acyltransferase PlsY [Finegoldia magna]
MNYLYLIILGIVCYFIGNISGSIAISKLVYKQDIRNYGSKNAGATNALRVYGVKVGLATFLIDFFKGLLCAYLGFKFYGSLGILVCGLLCVIGHILPVFYNFKGGKGIATSFGVLLFAQPLQVLILLILFLIVVLMTKYVSLGSVLGCISAVIYGLIYIRKDFYIGLIYILLGIISLFKHRSNINRLIHGKESKLGKN